MSHTRDRSPMRLSRLSWSAVGGAAAGGGRPDFRRLSPLAHSARPPLTASEHLFGHLPSEAGGDTGDEPYARSVPHAPLPPVLERRGRQPFWRPATFLARSE